MLPKNNFFDQKNVGIITYYWHHKGKTLSIYPSHLFFQQNTEDPCVERNLGTLLFAFANRLATIIFMVFQNVNFWQYAANDCVKINVLSYELSH